MGCRSTSYEVEQPRPGDSMRITHIPQYKSIPGFTTEILSDHPILIRRDSKGKPRLLLALGDGTEDSCRLGIHGAGRRDLVAFTPSQGRKCRPSEQSFRPPHRREARPSEFGDGWNMWLDGSCSWNCTKMQSAKARGGTSSTCSPCAMRPSTGDSNTWTF